jgi:hypothetical protein
MATSSKIKKVAKKLLSLSLDKEGRVDEVKVKSILESLREDPPSNHRALLRVPVGNTPISTNLPMCTRGS